MKKFLLFIATIALIACNHNEPTAQHQVTFKLPQFTSTTETMNAPAKAPASLVDGDDVLTDLYLFDGNTELMHQTSDQQDFGTITVILTAGQHTLHFVATKSTGLAYSNGVLACTSLKNTFGKTITIGVNGNSEQNVTLDRLSGKLTITLNDAIPSGASNLRVQLGDRYTSLDVATLYGVDPAVFDQNINISSKIGQSGYNVNLFMLAPDADGYETDFTLTATNTSSQIIGQATGTITIAPNTKTLLSGNLFSGTCSFIALSTGWNTDIEESF